MRKLTLAIVFSICLFSVNAQILQDLKPISQLLLQQESVVPAIQLPAIDLKKLQREDELNDKFKNKPWRFGEKIELSVNPASHGLWEDASGILVWRMLIRSGGAISLNYTFDQFFLPPSARLFIINRASGEFLGAITAENNSASNQLVTWPFQGNEHVLQLEVAPQERSLVKLHIKEVTHGYRNYKSTDGIGDSEPCNINAICPDAAAWPDQRKAALMIMTNGAAFCSGTLINNTLNNKKPYVLTAEHCGLTVENWVFRFNFLSSTCGGNSFSGSMQSVSGATMKAHNGISDFSLLEMNATPPQSFDVYYAGWDRSDNIPSTQFVFHHPSGDLKKYSQNNDPATKSYFLDASSGEKTWKIGSWDKGTTEGGSSGSGLYDQNGKIIGQLSGGDASCNNTSASDFFGRLAIGFQNPYCDSTNTLEYWLDPGYSGVNSIDGLNDETPVNNLDVAISGLSGFCNNNCGGTVNPKIKISNLGSQTVSSFNLSLAIDGNNVNNITWTGGLDGGQSIWINFNELQLSNGNHQIAFNVSNPNNGNDNNPTNNQSIRNINVTANGLEHRFDIVLDLFGSENSWVILNASNDTVATDGPYSDNNSGITVTRKVCLEPACYTLNFRDEYGDGMCCSFGNGSYALIESRGDTLAKGWRTPPGTANVPAIESTAFCVPVGIDELSSSIFKTFPNPTTGAFYIETKRADRYEYILTDITGKYLSGGSFQGSNLLLNLAGYQNGLYLLHIKSGEQTETLKVQLLK